jgi:hypothetical protein
MRPSILDEIQYLPVEENVNPMVDRYSFLKVIGRPNSDKYTVSLEDTISLCKESGDTFQEVLTNISEINRICESDICFSVRPSSLMIDEDVQYVYKSLLEDGIDVYTKVYNNPTDNEFGQALVEAVETGHSEQIVALCELFGLDRLKRNFKNGLSQGSQDALKDTGKGVVALGVNSIRNSIASGVQNAAEGSIRRRLDNFANTDRIRSWGQAHGLNDEGQAMLGDFANGVKKSLSQIGTDFLSGSGAAAMDKLKNMLDQVGQKIGFFSSRLANGNIDQNQRGLMQKGLDALKRLKDAIMNKIRSIRR